MQRSSSIVILSVYIRTFDNKQFYGILIAVPSRRKQRSLSIHILRIYVRTVVGK